MVGAASSNDGVGASVIAGGAVTTGMAARVQRGWR